MKKDAFNFFVFRSHLYRLTKARADIERNVIIDLFDKRSQPLPASAGGHKPGTDDVVGYLWPDIDATEKKLTLTSFRTLNTITDFRLDPPRGAKSQAAFVISTDVLNTAEDSVSQLVTSLVVDNAQLLTPVEAKKFGPVFTKIISFATQPARSREKDSSNLGQLRETQPKLRHDGAYCAAQQDQPFLTTSLHFELGNND